MGLYDITIQDMLSRNSLLRPEVVCLVCGDERWTFAQYAQESDRLASGLACLGVCKGDRIGALSFNCHEFFLLYGAAAKLGAIVVPINWRLKPKEIQLILEDCAPKVLVACPDHTDMVGELAGQYASVEHRLVMGKACQGFQSFQEVAASGAELLQADVTQQDPFVIIYTAAVEGRPRGAVLTHGNLMAASLQSIATMKIDARAVYLNLLPLFHIGGLVMALQVMYAGGRNVVLKRFDINEAVDWIEQEQVTIIGTFPPMLSMLLDHAKSSGRSLSTLQIVSGIESSDTIQRCERMTGAQFWVGYGQAETTGLCVICPFDERPGCAGKVCPLVCMCLVNDYDEVVPIEQQGEILIRGPLVFQGYWNLERETSRTFRGGWHHTGDIGRIDKDGYLWYVGRKAEKELIKPGGENVYPAEVEAVLLEHADVLEACVLGVPDEQWGEAVKAVCVCRKGSNLDPKALIEFVGSRIARYKKPKYVVFVEAFPKTEDGSVDRAQVRAKYGGPVT